MLRTSLAPPFTWQPSSSSSSSSLFISIGKNPQIARSTLKGSQNNNVMKTRKLREQYINRNREQLIQLGRTDNKDLLNSMTDDARRQFEGRSFHKTDALKA